MMKNRVGADFDNDGYSKTLGKGTKRTLSNDSADLDHDESDEGVNDGLTDF